MHEMYNPCTEDPKSGPKNWLFKSKKKRVRKVIGKSLCFLMNLHPSHLFKYIYIYRQVRVYVGKKKILAYDLLFY